MTASSKFDPHCREMLRHLFGERLDAILHFRERFLIAPRQRLHITYDCGLDALKLIRETSRQSYCPLMVNDITLDLVLFHFIIDLNKLTDKILKKYLIDENGDMRRGKPLSILNGPFTQDGTTMYYEMLTGTPLKPFPALGWPLFAYMATDWICKDYPDHCDHFFSKYVPGIFDGEREIIACYIDNKIAAVAILKKDTEERKISTFFRKARVSEARNCYRTI